jgi:hypothetical protein
MNCQECERLLEDSFEVALSEKDLARLTDHLKGCLSCRQYQAILEGETDLLASHNQDYLTHAVLQSTSGPSCVQAEELLCLDVGEVSRDEHGLLAAHVRFCPRCSNIQAWLEVAKVVLPALSEFDPGERFTASVLRATSDSPAPAPTWSANLRRHIGRLLERPRFSWEAAYVGTLLLLALVGNPAEYLRTDEEANLSRAADMAPMQVTQLVETVKTGLEQKYASSMANVELAEEALQGLLERSVHVLAALRETADKAETAMRQGAWSSLRRASGEIPERVQQGQPAEEPDQPSQTPK